METARSIDCVNDVSESLLRFRSFTIACCKSSWLAPLHLTGNDRSSERFGSKSIENLENRKRKARNTSTWQHKLLMGLISSTVSPMFFSCFMSINMLTAPLVNGNSANGTSKTNGAKGVENGEIDQGESGDEEDEDGANATAPATGGKSREDSLS